MVKKLSIYHRHTACIIAMKPPPSIYWLSLPTFKVTNRLIAHLFQTNMPTLWKIHQLNICLFVVKLINMNILIRKPFGGAIIRSFCNFPAARMRIRRLTNKKSIRHRHQGSRNPKNQCKAYKGLRNFLICVNFLRSSWRNFLRMIFKLHLKSPYTKD